MNILSTFSCVGLAVVLGTTAVAQDQEGWRLVAGSGPSARQLPAVAYDSVRKVAVLFGGAGAGDVPLGDTWEFDGRQWTQRTTAHAPSPRYGHGMAFDPGRGAVVLFGGDDYVQDTWEYDGVDWHQRSPVTSPAARYGTAMAYDQNRGRTVLFGGTRSNGQVDSELWEWDGVTWSLFSNNAIPGRRHHAMCWSSRQNGLVIVAGLNNSQIGLSDTGIYFAEGGWNYFANITARTGSSICENPLTNLLVLTGGNLLAPGPTVVADNLMYGDSGAAYSPRSPLPEPLSYHVSFFDERRHQVVVFGGLGPSGLSDRTYAYCANDTNGVWHVATFAGLSSGEVVDHAIGRFDADARKDLAMLLPSEGRVRVFLNANNGVTSLSNFTDTWNVALAAGADASSIAFGELGLGAGEELVVACPGRNQVDVVAGPSTPSVQSLAVGPLQLPVHALAGDLDGSPIGEVVAACRGTLLQPGGVSLVHDLGTSVQTLTHPSLARFERVALADFDGDGDVDVAALGHGATDGVWLLANVGGSLVDAGVVALPGSGAATDLAAADVDRDGDLDLVASSSSLFPFDNRLVVVRNDLALPLAAASFVTTSVPLKSGFTTRLSLGHVEGVERTNGIDIAFVDGLTGTGQLISWVSEAGIGTAVLRQASCVGRAALGDLNGDGCDDWVSGVAGGSVRVQWAMPRGRALTYGSGCAGSFGLRPVAAVRGRPAYYSTVVRLQQALGQTAAVLLLDLAPGNQPLGGGCSLLLDNPILLGYQVTDAVGRSEFGLSFPSFTIGYDLFAQWAVLDPNGSFTNLLALSNGLHLQLGI